MFCVDNMKASYLRSYVKNMSVTVLSCFRTEPRRRRDERGPIIDRRAFRLCIGDSDRDRLLNASKWPDSVVISEWYYVPPSVAAEKHRRAAEAHRNNVPAPKAVSSQHNTTTLLVIPAASSSAISTAVTSHLTTHTVRYLTIARMIWTPRRNQSITMIRL